MESDKPGAALVAAMTTPMLGVVTSFISNLEAWLRIANLTMTLSASALALWYWWKKRKF